MMALLFEKIKLHFIIYLNSPRLCLFHDSGGRHSIINLFYLSFSQVFAVPEYRKDIA
jgi:hypothetical protein